jgi:hypothetical protein
MSSPQHSASGANAGFDYQFERALYWLACNASGTQIGIETDDDVAVRGTESLILEQDKHSIRTTAEPFGDRSKDLWNTLAIWLEAIESHRVPSDSVVFLMVTNKVLHDCIAKQISAAKSEGEVAACITALEKAGENPPEHIRKLVERVLRSDSRQTLSQMLTAVELIDGSQSSAGEKLRELTIGHLQLPAWCGPQAKSIADELLGWIHKMALTAWRQNQPAWIERDNFINQLHAIIDLRQRQIRRERAEHLIPVTDANVGQEKGRPFVKQLHLVTDDDVFVDNAIREFIRCNIEKLRLSKEGNITDDDWLAFESTLLARWRKISPRVMRMKTNTPEKDIGYEILTETTESHREKLAGVDTEQVYLTSGTYHRMADLLRVGWHPQYETLMKKILKSP